MEMPKHRSRKEEKEEGTSSACGVSTKDTAREKAGAYHIEKDTGIL